MNQVNVRAAFQSGWQRLKWIVMEGDPSTLELFMVLWTLMWGVWFLSDAWHGLGQSTSLRALFAVASPLEWGGAMLILATLRLAALVSTSRHWRMRSMIGMVVVWTFITVLLFLANPLGPLSITYLSYALITIWVYVRLGTSADAHFYPLAPPLDSNRDHSPRE